MSYGQETLGDGIASGDRDLKTTINLDIGAEGIMGHGDEGVELDFAKTYGDLFLAARTKERIPAEFFSDTFLSYRLASLLTHVLPQAIYQLPSSGGYSFIDGEVYSMYGNSWVWNKVFFNGIETTSVFFPGKSLYLFLPVAHELHFDGLAGTRETTVHAKEQRFNYTGINVGQLGGHLPYYYTFLSNVHKAAQLRNPPVPEERPGGIFAFENFSRFVWPAVKGGTNSPFLMDVFVHAGRRQFLEFSYDGSVSTYRETTALMTLMGSKVFSSTFGMRLPKDQVWEAGFLSSISWRDRLGAEFRFNEDETLQITSLAFTPYLRSEHETTTRKFAMTFALHEMTGHTSAADRSYNLLRISGEGFNALDIEPGQVIEWTPQIIVQRSYDFFKKGFLRTALDNRFEFLFFSPQVGQRVEDIYFQDREQTVSLYQSTVRSENMALFMGKSQMNLLINDIEKSWWEVSVGLAHYVMMLADETHPFMWRTWPEFSLEVRTLEHRWVTVGLQLGLETIPFSVMYGKFISDGYQTRENYVWNDANSNKRAEATEVSDVLHSTRGGKYQTIADDFKQPHYYYVHIPMTFQMTPAWSFSMGGHYRTFRASPWVCPVGEAEAYGETRDIDGTNVFFAANATREYEVCNLPEEYFPSKGRNWFNNSPMYLGVTTGFNGVGKRDFFSITFSAFLINGITRRGNGPIHNSLGFFDTSMADPNNLIRPVGRYDADRSYSVRVIYSHAFLTKLIGTFMLSYRDGQPIGSWNYYVERDRTGSHVAWVREKVSGDNELLYNGEFGTREDAQWNFDVRWKWVLPLRDGKKLELHLVFYNLLDIALETLEYTVYQESSERIALETEVPRSVELAFKVYY